MVSHLISKTGRLAALCAVCVAFGTPALAQTANPCAIYGSGYVAIVGGGGCELIGGRVRVESHAPARPASHGILPNNALGYAAQQPAGPSPANRRAPMAESLNGSLAELWPGSRENNPRIR